MTYLMLYGKNGPRLTPHSTISRWECKDSTRPMRLTTARLPLPLLHRVKFRPLHHQGTPLRHHQMANLQRLLVGLQAPPQDRPAQPTTWHTGGFYCPKSLDLSAHRFSRAAYGYDVNSEVFKQWYAQLMAANAAQGAAGAAPPGPA